MTYDFDLIVLGGGAAGLSGSGYGATFGAKTLMVERDRLGGDCTWTGCVPSKTLLQGARVAHRIKRAHRDELIETLPEIRFDRLMQHVRRVREDVYEDADRPEIYEGYGVEVVSGEARFLNEHEVSIASNGVSRTVSSRYFLIATGASALVPPIAGLDGVPYLTNASLFELNRQPADLIVLGAGPVGCEMAQAFARLGTSVTVVDREERILSRDDRESAEIVTASMRDDGISFELDATANQFDRDGDQTIMTIHRRGTQLRVSADSVLIAAGRKPNLAALDLASAGVKSTESGVTVDDRCRTNQRHIFAAGDVTGRYQFTHMSEHMSRVAVLNMLTKLPTRIDTATVPWVTFTDPELGHVGATATDLERSGRSFRTYRFPYSKVDRAITDGATRGLIKVYARKRDGKILGADVVGASAGELISEYAVAMRNGVTLRKISDTIHPYPTYGLAARRAADQWYLQKYSPRLVRLLKWIFGYRGEALNIGPDDII